MISQSYPHAVAGQQQLKLSITAHHQVFRANKPEKNRIQLNCLRSLKSMLPAVRACAPAAPRTPRRCCPENTAA